MENIEITKRKWRPLIELIPVIEETKEFGEYIDSTKITENEYIYNGFKNSSVANEFFHRVYDNIITYDFDWMHWELGRLIIESETEVSYEKYDLDVLNKLIYALVRNDKYCDGYLITKLSDGTILKILKSIEAKLNNSQKMELFTENIFQNLNRVSKILFIKLGKGNEFAQECIENNYIKLDYRTVNHELCIKNQWERVQDFFINEEKTKKQVATSHTNQIKQFYTEGETTLWLTFNGNKLWWCFSKLDITVNEDNTKTRPTIGKWFESDILGNPLLTSNLSGKLLKTHGYQGTICNISESEYVINKLKGKDKEEIKEVKIALNTVKTKLAILIKHLQPQDFEILVDLIFRQMGWQRVSVLGKDLKTFDLELFSPITQERAGVQIKTGADLNKFKFYQKEFETMTDYDKFFFIVSSPQKDLMSFKNEDKKIKLYLTEDVANLTLSAGLTNWVIQKSI
ncbi:DUF6508 domain-containing protein [Draconibacterium orientale]|uniref:DUF6508 domain-containing protein n=1 Tax=Draconibacterium orientale TaxID=1168034 RepID=UPI002A0A1B8C|nr:DUF6508 domain-containing protein [Draconibacterium orientale]